ncbi:hypothetical protein DFH27DRAFT_609481 [Peziza echinospora]|nr:hypothetical protein DFH27DRAFT_609481 [Peziza echinospora]
MQPSSKPKPHSGRKAWKSINVLKVKKSYKSMSHRVYLKHHEAELLWAGMAREEELQAEMDPDPPSHSIAQTGSDGQSYELIDSHSDADSDIDPELGSNQDVKDGGIIDKFSRSDMNEDEDLENEVVYESGEDELEPDVEEALLNDIELMNLDDELGDDISEILEAEFEPIHENELQGLPLHRLEMRDVEEDISDWRKEVYNVWYDGQTEEDPQRGYGTQARVGRLIEGLGLKGLGFLDAASVLFQPKALEILLK